MGMAGQKLEMLFISHVCRRKGIGFALMQYGMERYSLSWLTVNEQNPEANVFYESFGFHTYKRTELDEEGNLYPLLYMKRIGWDMCTKAKVVRRFPLKMVALYKCFVPLYHFSFPS